jgi:PAS domain S-box-containing protein
MITVLASLSVSAAEPPRRISIAYCSDCVPFHFTEESGQPAGIMIDLWRLWSEKTGIAIDFQAAVWDETLTKVGSGAVDAHAGLFFNKERDKFLDYGTALTETATHCFSHKSLPPINRVSDLADYKVGVISGDFVEGYLKDRLPHSNVVPFSDYDSLMKALRRGSLRVFAADTPTGLFHLKKAGLTSEFTFVIEKPLYQSDWFVAVKEGNKPLIEVINRGMTLISDEEKLEINRHWLGGTDEKGEALVISIDRAYAPLTFINSFGRPSGILVDLWRTWAKETGRLIKFKASSWSETLEGLKNGDADIHSGLSLSKEREGWIGFSTQVYETFTRIYYRVGDPQPAGIGEYGTDGVGVMFGSYQAAKFKEVYPNVMTRSLVATDDLIDALLKGEVKAVVQEEAAMEAAMDRLGLHGDITSRAERLFPSAIHAGVLKGNTDLLQEINNGLALIPRAKLVAIEKPWIPNPEARFYQPETKKEEQYLIDLTDKEKDFLKQHPTLRLGVDAAYPPFEYVDKEGVYRGMASDYVTLVSRMLGVKMEIVPGLSWAEVIEKAKDRVLDIVPCLNETQERKKFLNFSNSYISFPTAIMTRTDNMDVTGTRDLIGKKVAVVESYSTHERLQRMFPDVIPFPVSSTLAGLKAVLKNEAEAFVGNLATNSLVMQENSLVGLKAAAYVEWGKDELAFGVRSDWPELVPILNKALDVIPQEKHIEIKRRWVPLPSEGLADKFVLTSKQKKWLSKHPKLRLGVDPAWPPFEFIDKNGNYAGIGSGFIEAISDRLNIKMTPIPGLTWSQVIEKAKAGEIDVLPAVIRTPDRDKYLNFTKPYLSFPIVTAINKNTPYIGSIKDLAGYRVGVVKDYYTENILRNEHPYLKLVTYATLAEALQELDTGHIDVFIDNLVTITQEIARSGLENTRISASTAYTVDLSLGVRKDLPELVEILNKVLDDISNQEKAAIKSTWMGDVDVKIGFDFKAIMAWAIPIGVGVFLIILFVVIWNRRLGSEISARKKVEDELRTSQQTLRIALESSNTGVWKFDPHTNESFQSEQWYKQIGYERDEFKADQDLFAILLHSDDEAATLKAIEDHVEGVTKTYEKEFRLKSKDGTWRWILSKGQITKRDSDGKATEMTGVHLDITERKRFEETLEFEKQRFQTLLESAPSGIVMIGKDNTWEYINPKFKEMFGYDLKDVPNGKQWFRLAYPDPDYRRQAISAWIEKAENAKAGGEYLDLNFKVRCKDGTEKVVHFKTVLLHTGDHLLTCEDITERKKAEEELRQNMEDLERFSKLAVRREERMIELKKKINELLRGLGQQDKYKIVA